MELKDLQETAALARLNMSVEELEKTFPVFEETLSFFATMQDADKNGTVGNQTECLAPAIPLCRLRPDTVSPGDNLCESILSQAPDCDGRFIVIPNVL